MHTCKIIDLHCDLLSYLAENDTATPYDKENIGCAFPYLKEGNVKLQVMAIYTPTEIGSTAFGLKQAKLFRHLLTEHANELLHIKSYNDALQIIESDKIGIAGAIENASAFCEEDEHLDKGFKKLEQILGLFEKTLYITITHMKENRFGGGNLSESGLKEDGKILLDYLSGKNVAVDLSHTSDKLAHGILNHIDKNGLTIPLLASHSNFRSVHAHKAKRNLPDEIADEIIKRGGVIGINLIKDFIGHNGHKDLYKHIIYGYEKGFGNNLSFGADFFWAPPSYKCDTGEFFYTEHRNAGRYPEILKGMLTMIPVEDLHKFSYQNGLDFIKRVWS